MRPFVFVPVCVLAALTSSLTTTTRLPGLDGLAAGNGESGAAVTLAAKTKAKPLRAG